VQVAPAELEGLLLQHPGLSDAAVIGRPDERTGEAPVAFVVRRAAPAAAVAAGPVGAVPAHPHPTEEEVKAWIEPRVAEYKKLAEVRFVEAIPKSAAGKILRRVLRDQLTADE
jgi:4-coumarate--CoA ligase